MTTIHLTMIDPKQQAIRKAWGAKAYDDIYNALKDCHHAPWALGQFTETGRVTGNLIRDPDVAIHFQGRTDIKSRNGSYWPTALTGIKDNNGWTRLESADDLPEKGGTYIWLYPDGVRTTIAYEEDEDDKGKQWFVRRFTHWRPIVEIPGPVY